uniref:MAGUK p55 subfamily member 7 n=2 Tax=Mesocestoides corti TaxID=53468 RepID=A0A5K3FRP8_MESCO
MDGKQAHRCCEHCRGGHSASHRSTASQTPARFHRRPPRTTSHRSNVLFVEISKAKGEAIGMTLRPSSSGRCIVARIMHGGLAHRTGLIHVRDEILEVNGHVLLGRPVENIQQYLLALQDTVILKISPSTKGHRPPCQMFVRAMFDYKPREDPELPCPELGQPFNVGDILEIVDAADFTWWQARPHNSRAHSHPAGLIPSTDLQESRVVRATNEAREALIAEALNFSNNTTHLSSLLSLLIPRRSRGGGERSSASTSSTGAGATSTELAVAMGTLERTFSHWLPFRRRSSHHRGSSRRLHRRGSSRHRAISATARPSVSEDDDDDDADNDDDGDDAGAGARGRLNGNILDDLSSLGGTIPSQTCSKCNSLLRASVPTTSAQRRQKWAESAPFLLCELPFQPYEEVARRPAFRYRTLVILGAHGVGRRPLRKALIQARPDLFGAVIP